MRSLIVLIFSFLFIAKVSAQDGKGLLTGNLLDESGKPIAGATIILAHLSDTANSKAAISAADGSFQFSELSFAWYRIRISFIGYTALGLDSIHLRAERSDFHLPDLVLKRSDGTALGEVIVYAEKPLIESKDGNITFNAGESALSAGSNASELLNHVPLVTKDADGKIAVRGKEPRILIDDKPVELNMQQLQDLLESMPGSSIEKIEVMTNPPPQYANEQGGVINIVTKKGKVGRSGRASVTAGSRGELSTNIGFNYRKKGFNFNLNAGVAVNEFEGNGYSYRTNIYADSTNSFATRSSYTNRSVRPNFRFNMDYTISKYHSVSATLNINANDFNNRSGTEYTNRNRFEDIYRLSERSIRSTGENLNGSFNIAYTIRSKVPGELFRIIADVNRSANDNDRDFYQQFFYPDHNPTGVDSTQEQVNKTVNSNFSVRISYDRPLVAEKLFISTGSFLTRHNSDVSVISGYFRKPDGSYVPLDLLSNDFIFHQTLVNFRSSLRYNFHRGFSISAGASFERTGIWFELLKENRDVKNNYGTWLPFANLNRRWANGMGFTASWRRSIRRPGINELNPAIDFSDPYNIRFGNAALEASTADNFDVVVSKTKGGFFLNLGTGYNIVRNIFSRVRTLLPDGKTQITWENISGRREYEISAWGGMPITRKIRLNLSSSYTFNQYSSFDRRVNRYRNGGSFTSNVSSSYIFSDKLSFNGSFTFNRFANPQGYARWNWSMNTGVQQKFFRKRLSVTLNVIDPFVQQRNRNFTYGTNFRAESFNATNTRNFRVTLGYNLFRPAGVIKK